jgi:hypothetical protein
MDRPDAGWVVSAVLLGSGRCPMCALESTSRFGWYVRRLPISKRFSATLLRLIAQGSHKNSENCRNLGGMLLAVPPCRLKLTTPARAQSKGHPEARCPFQRVDRPVDGGFDLAALVNHQTRATVTSLIIWRYPAYFSSKATVHVMLAVLGRPPQNAALRSRLRQNGQSKLKDPTSSECAVGKVSVITGTDRENANPDASLCQPHTRRRQQKIVKAPHCGGGGDRRSPDILTHMEVGSIEYITPILGQSILAP